MYENGQTDTVLRDIFKKSNLFISTTLTSIDVVCNPYDSTKGWNLLMIFFELPVGCLFCISVGFLLKTFGKQNPF